MPSRVARGAAAILHHQLGFRQPTSARFMPFCGPVKSHVDRSRSLIHPISPVAQQARCALRAAGRPHVQVRPSVIHSLTAARWNLSTGELVHGRRVDLVLTGFWVVG
jgi:hypothetical protein